MDCEHAESTTLLWLYGEGDAGHEAHVASCPVCQAVVAEHADVAAALGPALRAVAEVPAPRRRWGAWLGGGLALAAAVMLAVRAMGPEAPVASVVVEPPLDAALSAALAASVEPFGADDRFDAQLDDLDLALEGLSRDLEML